MVETQTITASGTGPVTVDTYAFKPARRSIFVPPEDDCEKVIINEFLNEFENEDNQLQ